MRIPGASKLMRRGGRAVSACLVLLAACGGGTSQIEPFAPRQIIVLGDESAVLAADGKSYSINALTSTNAIDCSGLRIWTQQLVASFGMALDRCNPTNAGTTRGVTRGTPGAKADDIEAQITAQFNAEAPPALDAFCLRCLRKNPWSRFLRAYDIVTRLRSLAGDAEGNVPATRRRPRRGAAP